MPPTPRLVPTTRDVRPGAPVHIVLKADQPTGRTVAGVVRDVLTRGNHPRGIKVRLADGRVGRVQGMASAAASLDSNAQDLQGVSGGRSEVPAQTLGLDAYIKPAKTKRGGRRGSSSTPGEHGGGARNEEEEEEEEAGCLANQAASSAGGSGTSATAKCPVCGAFEGDEAAVTHHVAGHFDG